MKRFYKFLMPLVAIVAMALPYASRAQDTVTIGTGTSTTYYVPFNSLYGYSFTEQVYQASDINTAGQITAVQFYLGTSSSDAQTNSITLYMKNVTRSTFSSTSDYEPVSAADVVFNGTWTIPANYTGWVEIELDSPFDYDGVSNLMVAMHESTSGYSTRYFTYTSATNSGISFYSDSYNPDPYNLSSYSGSVYQRSYLANMRLAITSVPLSCYPVRNLTVSDIVPQGCTLTWVDTSNSSASYILYNMADSSIIDVVYDTSYVLTGLSSNTNYEVGVVTLCGSDDSSSWRRISFRTACSPTDSIPYTEDFESYGSGTTAFPSCWYKLGSTADRPYIHGTTTYGHNNTHGLYFYAASTGYCYGIMPPVDPTIDLSTLQIHFWARQYSTSYDASFVVGMMTDPTDATTFVAIDTVHPTGTTYEEFEVPLDSYTGTGTYVAFSAIWNSGSGIYLMLDDVTLEEVPTCPPPYSASLSATATGDTIIVRWTGRVSDQDYEVVYGAPGFNPDNESPISVTGDSLLIDGLTMGDVYDFYVRTDCGTEYSQWIGPVTAVVGLVEYNMTVTGTNTLTGCAFTIYDDGGSTDSYSTSCNSTLYVYPSDDEHVISVSGTSYTEGSWDYLRIYEGIGTTGNVIFDDYGVSSTQTFGPYISESGPITIVFVSDGTVTYSGFEITTICVPAPACVLPSNVTVTNVTNHEATISWNANSNYNEMNVYWGTNANFANATDSTIVSGENSYTITGLAANTTYHAWIKASCTDGDSRAAEVSFTTLLNCYPVTGLSVTAGPVSAMAAWTQSQSEWTDLTVEYKPASDTAWTSASTTNNYFPMTGLTPATEYNFRIIATCVEGTSVAATANFRTTNFGCLEADSANLVNDTIGNGTSTSSYFPSYSTYNYSLTQQIYLATDFSAVAGGQIEHIGIQMSAVPVARNIEIYMTNTSATNVSSAFIPIATSDLVWSGSTTGNITAGWNDITLTTPFNYTGGNILVTFRDMTGSWSSGNSGMVSTVTSGISRYVYQDGSSYSVTNPTGGTASNSRLNMYFVGGACLTPSTCAAPIVVANAAGTTAIDLNWAPGASETSWMVYQRLAGDTAYTLAATVNTTNYTATGLNPGLDYEFKVVAVCGNNDMAGFASASTECAPVAVPYTEDFQNAEYGEYSRNCWTVGSTNLGTNYPIPYVISLTGDENNKLCLIYNGGYMIMPEMDAPLNTLQARFTLVQGGDNVRLIIGLMSDPTASINNIVALDTLIRSDIDTSSSTVTITFPFDMLPAGTTGHITFWDAFNDNYSFIDNLVIEPIPACTAVTGVTVTDVTTTGATVSWTASGSTATGYLVEYGPRNFVPGNGTVVNASTNSINLTGLNHSSDYDVYVYTVCSGLGDTSMASNRARFTTPCDVVTLPYFQNFDNCTDPGTTRSPLPNCWNYSMLSTGTYAGSSYTPAVYYTTTTGYTSSGDYCLYLYGTALTVLPEMPTTVDSLYISFHHYTSSPSYYRLIIGAVDSITPGFDSSFVGIDTLVFNSNENNVLRFLSTYTGTGRYIAFKNYYNNNTSDYSYHYIDDLEVGYMPSCVWPVDVHATGLTTTTAEFAWSICQATDYEYEYGPAGFTRGTGTTGTWSGAPYGISGLTLGTQYDIYVRGICGAGDTSNWSSVYTFGTLNADPATVPFYCDFTDTTLTNAGWEVVNGTQNNQWVVGAAESNGTPNALYISNDNGTSNSYTTSGISITYAYRDVMLTDGQYALTYDWKANGESTWDYIRAWLVPASQMPTAGLLPDGTTATSTFNSSGVAPAGWISIDGGAKLNLASSWQTHEEELNLTAGTYHLLFMWANDASGGSNPPAAIDNVTLTLNVCPISDITFVNVSGSSAQVTWTGSSDGYEIEYGPAGFLRGSGTTINTTTNSATLNGLASLTTYDVYLRAFCNVTDTSRWYRASFTTEMCNNPEVVATGTDSTATGTSYYVPVNNFYNYTLSETIIDSAEIGGAMDITALAYYYTYSTPTTAKTDVTIWLQPTTKSSFSSTTDIEALDSTTAVMVYNGELNCSQGWNYFSLSTPYSYNGIGNLMVIVDDNSGDYDNSSSTFATVATTDYKTLVYYSDSYNPDINDLTSSYSGSTYRYQYRPYMQLINCGSATCLDPVITSNTVEETTASISWDATGASGYEVAIVEGAWVEPATGTPVTDTFYTFTGLTEQTNYTLAVRSACGNGSYSSWVILPITTLRHPCAVPTAVTVSNQSYDGATISWTLGEAEDQWQVHIFSTSPYYDSTYAVSATPSFEVSGLDDGVTYSVAVRAVCDPTWMSPWSDTVALTTVTCTQVTGVSASNVAATSATITWTATGVDSYIIEYGESGFTMGQGTTVTSTTNSISLTGLEEQTAYNVYVSGVCAEGVTSTYSERYTFTTPAGNGIDEVESGDVTLFPNPASTSVTIRGIEGDATVTVVDLNGRVNGEWKVADGEIRLDLTGYAKGAYFVRITGERTTAIRKLIVR